MLLHVCFWYEYVKSTNIYSILTVYDSPKEFFSPYNFTFVFFDFQFFAPLHSPNHVVLSFHASFNLFNSSKFNHLDINGTSLDG